ncbi:virulence factor TspB C-terminal domain-related protein [Paraburkholderia sp. 2C]
MCELDPSASACALLGTATADTLPSSSVSVSLTPWDIGPSTGTCPGPVVIPVFGYELSFSWTPMCTFAADVRPIVLAVCGIAAAFIVAMGI